MSSAPRTRSRRRLIALGVVLALILGLGGVYQFGVKRLPPTDPVAMDSLDREMFAELQQVYEMFAARPADLWDTTYRYDREPLLLVRRDSDDAVVWPYVYLVNMSSMIDTSGFARIAFPEDGVLSDVRVATDVDPALWKAWMPGNFTPVDIAGRRVLAFKYAPNQFVPETPSGLRFPRFSLHEAFHVNVQATWRQDQDEAGSSWPVPPPAGEERRAAFAEEFAAWDAATGVDDAETLWPLAERIVAARRAELTRYPQMAPRDGLETIEGTARYLEFRYERLAGTTIDPSSAVGFSDVLGMDAESWSGEDIFHHALWYETGAALGLMLDELAPDWKTSIADGETTMFDVLVAAVDAHAAAEAPVTTGR